MPWLTWSFHSKMNPETVDIGTTTGTSLEQFGSRTAITFLTREGPIERSGNELRSGAERAADFLRSEFPRGKRLLLSAAPGPDRIILLLACWFADLIPSVVDIGYPTDPSGLEKLEKSRFLNDGTATLLIQEPDDPESGVVDSGDIVLNLPAMENSRFLSIGTRPFAGESENDAYIQFSSGTTGKAKGVRLSARAILSCIDEMSVAYQLVSEDVIINPLPLSHDFGLFGGLLLPLIKGATSVQIAPELWSRNPTILLRAISERGGTICYLPNSGFELCTRFVRTSALSDLDLSSVKFWMNASEPIMPGTRRRFLDRFRECGLRQSMLATGYGMAENTLAVSFSGLQKPVPVDRIDVDKLQRDRLAVPVDEPDNAGMRVVGCGFPLNGVQVRILDEQGDELPERHVGEIAVRSDFLFNGYLADPEGTASCMKDGWFLTGDLGYQYDGQLYFTGRSKDLIILGGRNIHPDEIESVVIEGTDILPAEVAAFGYLDPDRGTERLVIVVVATGERRREWPVLEQQIRKQVWAAAGIAPDHIMSVRRGWIQRTGNGKRDRNAMRDRYLRENNPNGNTCSMQP